jgi:translation initiation factor IF-2|tara:strand:+ start:1827 stop:2069 length:243 start_codon:yes stop_codon:yes gene_type:complete
MYNYKLIREDEDKAKLKFQEERVNAFNEIEDELQSLIKPLRQAKIETIKYYRENPNSYSVVTGTDLIKDFIKDIKTLLEK